MASYKQVTGLPITQQVLDELDKRSNILSSTSYDTSNLLYLHSNTSWVRMCSSVIIGGDETIAQKFILSGGTLSYSPTEGGKLRETFNLSSNDYTSSYSTFKGNDGLGFRPMPGISDLKITHKGTEGALREAEASFKVWSLEDLDQIEPLYLRPGFHIILEWGHSVYYDKDKNFINDPKPLELQQIFTTNSSVKDLESKIKTKRELSGFNYDGMVGVITNFQYSYGADGGYDCSLKLVSRGAIIEALSNRQQKAGSVQEEGAKEDQNLLTGIFKAILDSNAPNLPVNFLTGFSQRQTIGGEEKGGVNYDIISLFKNAGRSPGFLPLDEKYDDVILISETKDGLTVTRSEEPFARPMKYIRMGTFLNLLNSASTLSYNTDSKKEDVFSINSRNAGNKYLTYANHFCINHQVAVLPKLPSNENLSFIKGAESTFVPIAIPNEVTYTSDDILMIYLNVGMLVEKTKEAKTVLDLVDAVLVELNRNLGGINNLELHLEQDTQTYYVVDRQVNPDTKPGIINVTGLKSTATNISVTSKIPTALNAAIAISAQEPFENINEESASKLLSWNKGLTDRFKTKIEPKIKFDYSLALNNLVVYCTGIRTNTSVDYLELESVRNDFELVTKQDIHDTKQGVDNPPAGMLPFTLNLTLLGISGLKIGECFRINKGILPHRVYDRMAFRIVRLSESLSNNKWQTEIEAQTILISGTATTVTKVFEEKEAASDAISAIESRIIEGCGEPVVPNLATLPTSTISIQFQQRDQTLIAAFWKNQKESKSLCARYTYNLALTLVSGATATRLDQQLAGGNARDIGYRNKLRTLGYVEYSLGENLKNKQIQAVIKDLTDRFLLETGDILIYWANDTNGNETKYGHTQMLVSYNSPKYTSSVKTNYNTDFVYKSKPAECWNLVLMKAPPPGKRRYSENVVKDSEYRRI